MEQYIKKSALVAEIVRRRKEIPKNETDEALRAVYGNEAFVLTELLSFIDTLETKEVDLDGEYERFLDEVEGVPRLRHSDEQIEWAKDIAKHFFELGVRTTHPITANDRGVAEEIIINLKRIEKDYRIDLTKEIEWLRIKTKK